MLSVIANIDVMTWMVFAFSGATGLPTAIIIASLCSVILGAIVFGWGRVWNKKWTPSVPNGI